MPIEQYISLWDIGGTLRTPEAALSSLHPTLMIANNSALRGSNTGSNEVLQMLELATKSNVRSWIEVMTMAKCIGAIEKAGSGEQRYRIILEAGK